MAVSREDVLNVFRLLPDGSEITTQGIVFLLTHMNKTVTERQVRACISWLMLGGLIEETGRTLRRDVSGQLYRAKLYRWTGCVEVRRVHRAEHLKAQSEEDEAMRKIREVRKLTGGLW